MNITTLDGILEFHYDVDQTFLADNLVHVRQLPDLPLDVDFPATTGEPLPFPRIGLAFCELHPTLGNWSRLYHDPTLSVLFNPPLGPATPHQKHSRDLAIGLSIGLIALALIIIVVIVLLAWKVPKVRNFFRPYSARSNKSSVGSPNVQ